VTWRDWSIVTVQVPSPGHEKPGSELDQPANAVPPLPAGVAVNVTLGEEKPNEHVLPQLMPDGLLVTVPLAPVVDVFATARFASVELKVAVTLRAWLIVTTHVPVPEQPSPLQPMNWTFAPGVAVSVTTVFWGICAEQAEPQLIPPVSLVTVLPLAGAVPFFVTVRGKATPAKLAVTVRAMFMFTVQVPVPGQLNPASELLQPRKLLPAVGVAVSVTFTPFVKSAWVPVHAALQLIPDGLLVTVPVAPATTLFNSVNVCVVAAGPPSRAQNICLMPLFRIQFVPEPDHVPPTLVNSPPTFNVEPSGPV
jgi:hypothetical protein